MLAPRMALGYGVSEAVAMVSRELHSAGVQCVVGCLEDDGRYEDLTVVRVPADAEAVADLAADHRASVVVAHGSPYFEVLPALTDRFHTVAYEYGDPTPALFTDDAAGRQRVADAKRESVYPAVAEVATISDFIRHDVRWPSATVVRLGVDHIPVPGPGEVPAAEPGRPLRVGALMRLGEGEARYKGQDELLRLAELTGTANFEVVGRGSSADGDRLRRRGIAVHLNASDEERADFLRDIDVFVTTSLWEGTNLPLLEAQAVGTPALALDTGAHPEFTPLVFDSLAAMALQLERFSDDRRLVRRYGAMAQAFVQERFTWQATAMGLLALCQGGGDRPPVQPRRRWRRQWARAQRLRRGVAEVGLRETLDHHLHARRRGGNGRTS